MLELGCINKGINAYKLDEPNPQEHNCTFQCAYYWQPWSIRNNDLVNASLFH